MGSMRLTSCGLGIKDGPIVPASELPLNRRYWLR
jgi:hypothetical protein